MTEEKKIHREEMTLTLDIPVEFENDPRVKQVLFEILYCFDWLMSSGAIGDRLKNLGIEYGGMWSGEVIGKYAKEIARGKLKQ